MTKFLDIITAIESLSPDDYVRLREWFYSRDWQKLDEQIEAESKAIARGDYLLYRIQNYQENSMRSMKCLRS
ncbi:MAG: hypothetical protein HY741_24325 [Chloroflexi bacterium]|nr:hypothetical protein [Chloroflexota bacterium]